MSLFLQFDTSSSHTHAFRSLAPQCMAHSGKLLLDASDGCKTYTQTLKRKKKLWSTHDPTFFPPFSRARMYREAQRIFNLQIMSWFIAKNVSESWNVNWNLMLSRLKGNSQIFRYNVFGFFFSPSVFALALSPAATHSSFVSLWTLHACGTCALARIKSQKYGLSGWIGWI